MSGQEPTFYLNACRGGPIIRAAGNGCPTKEVQQLK